MMNDLITFYMISVLSYVVKVDYPKGTPVPTIIGIPRKNKREVPVQLTASCSAEKSVLFAFHENKTLVSFTSWDKKNRFSCFNAAL